MMDVKVKTKPKKVFKCHKNYTTAASMTGIGLAITLRVLSNQWRASAWCQLLTTLLTEKCPDPKRSG